MIQRYGLWRVTTEGDVEGRSTTQLGEFKGNLDEIAFFLADKCYYTLEFTLLDETPRTAMAPTGATVNIRVNGKGNGYSSSAFALDNGCQAQVLRTTLRDTNVGVKAGNYYKSVTLSISKDEAEMRRIAEEAARNRAIKAAREKLNAEELRLLGIN